MYAEDSVSGNFAFDTAAHGDFLGAILGTGVTREKVGDIIVQVIASILSIRIMDRMLRSTAFK